SVKDKTLVQGVGMNVKKGEIYGFLGPNGAGKTTVLRMIMSLVKPSSGEIELFGRPLEPGSTEQLKRMGSLIEYPNFYEKLSAKENLELHCEYMGYYRKNAVSETLGLVGLADTGKTPVKQ